MAWTRFMDMHSGGGQKVKGAEYIFIEAPQEQAEIIFYNKFGRNPNRVTCTCCGADYSISESADLKQASGYDRSATYWAPPKKNGRYQEGLYLDESDTVPDGWVNDGSGKWRTPIEFAEWEADPSKTGAMLIRADDIKDAERIGTLPEEGYVWH